MPRLCRAPAQRGRGFTDSRTPKGLLVDPAGQEARCGVLVLSGSSGRLEVAKARLLAADGAAAAAVRYFGGRGQSPGLCEVALETLSPALDQLAQRSDHLAVWGASKGAEAALLLAAADQRVRSVIAVAPTSSVWPSVCFAGQIAARRCEHGRDTTVLVGDGAGHRVLLLGEAPYLGDGAGLVRGGTARDDAELGARLWEAATDLLDLGGGAGRPKGSPVVDPLRREGLVADAPSSAARSSPAAGRLSVDA